MSESAADVRREIVEQALRWLADADLEHIVKALTPELIAADIPRSASTVRYHFRSAGEDGRGLAFRRRDLAIAMLESALEAGVRASDGAAVDYTAAAESLPDAGAIDDILSVLTSNLEAFTPGATAEDVSPRERMYLLGLAVCDTDGQVARMLRAAREQQIRRYEPMYHRLIARMDRELRPERTAAELASAIYAMLDGHLNRLRFEPHASGAWLGDAVLAVFAAFTQRRGEPPEDVRAALLASRGRPAPPAP